LLVSIVVDPLALPNLTPSVEEVPLVSEKSLSVVRGPRFVTSAPTTIPPTIHYYTLN
jgi:hypothetical protein